MVSVALMVTIILKNFFASASLIAIFYIMLIVIDQLYVYEINHWFANFMPIHMTEFWHFYTGNELYRIWGRSIPCLNWSIVMSLILSAIFCNWNIRIMQKQERDNAQNIRGRRVGESLMPENRKAGQLENDSNC